MKSVSAALVMTTAFALSLSLGAPDAGSEPGKAVWEQVFPGEPTEDSFRANALAQDAQGNIFVAGTMSAKSGDADYVTLKYGPGGTGQWARLYNHSWYDVGRGVAADLIGESVVAGASYDLENPRDTYSNSYYTGYRVIKYNPNGEVMYEMAASGNGKNNEPTSAVVDLDGDIYVTGTAYTGSGSYKTFYTVKFSATGRLIWERFEDWGAESVATCAGLDADGSLLVAGYVLDPVNNDHNIKLLRYGASDGRPLMELTYDHLHEDELAFGLAVDKDGGIVVTGQTGSVAPAAGAQMSQLPSQPGAYMLPPAQDAATLLLKYTPDGRLSWNVSYSKSEYRNRGIAAAVDPDKRIYVAGRTYRPDLAGDILLLVYDRDGRLIDERTFTYGGESYPAGIALDDDGGILLAGTTALPGTPGIIRTMKLEAYPPLMPLVPPEQVFDGGVPVTLRQPARRMLRKVELTVTTTDVVEGSPVVVFKAHAVGQPGVYEYRFFVSDAPGSGEWAPATEYSEDDSWVYRPGRWNRKPVAVMVRARPKGSGLGYEASQTIEYTP